MTNSFDIFSRRYINELGRAMDKDEDELDYKIYAVKAIISAQKALSLYLSDHVIFNHEKFKTCREDAQVVSKRHYVEHDMGDMQKALWRTQKLFLRISDILEKLEFENKDKNGEYS